MHISQITGYSNQYQNNRLNKSKFKTNNMTFGNFDSVYRNAITTKLTDTAAASQVFTRLLNAIKREPGIRVLSAYDKLPSLNNTNEYLKDTLSSVKSCIKRFGLKSGRSVIVNSKGQDLLSVEDEGLKFSNPEFHYNNQMSFSINDNKEILVEYLDDDLYEKYLFYNDSPCANLKQHTHTSGKGYNAVSNSEYFNRDGSENTLKNFFGWFGL